MQIAFKVGLGFIHYSIYIMIISECALVQTYNSNVGRYAINNEDFIGYLILALLHMPIPKRFDYYLVCYFFSFRFFFLAQRFATLYIEKKVFFWVMEQDILHLLVLR